MFKEFRDFAVRGNVLDLAVGVIIGGSFGKIVTSFVSDIMMPPIGLLIGKVDFSNLYLNLSGGHYSSLAEAKKAGAATVNIGLFANQVIDFTIVAFAVFMMVNALHKVRLAHAEPSHKQNCPYCTSSISDAATRCPQCTSDLKKSS
jgi:large conductance mechanosensitive channel